MHVRYACKGSPKDYWKEAMLMLRFVECSHTNAGHRVRKVWVCVGVLRHRTI